MTTLSDVWKTAIGPRERRPIGEWARDNLALPATMAKGRFDTESSRHLGGPLKSVESDLVREVNIMAPPRSGKTLIADVSAPWAIASDNASVLWVFQDEANAKLHGELRAIPILKSCPQLKSIWPRNSDKDRTKEILFENGLPFVLTGQAIGKLQSRGYKWVICDEPWQYKEGILAEAKARLGDFEKIAASKFIAISQGGKEGDDWTTQFNTGQLFEWDVVCIACGHRMPPKWSAFRDDETRWGICYESVKDAHGKHDKQRAIETMRFECRKCGHGHSGDFKTWGHWNRNGGFVAHGQDNPRKHSYRFNDLITGAPWDVMLEEWLDAEDAFSTSRNPIPRQKFIQKRLAESLSDSSIYGERRFERSPIEVTTQWPDDLLRFATFDRQHEGVFYCVIRAWAKGGESRRLFRGKLFGVPDIQRVLDEYKVATFVTTKGRASCAFMDSGDSAKGISGAYADCIRIGMIAMKGDGSRSSFSHKLKNGAYTQRLYAPQTLGDPFDGQLHRPGLSQTYQLRGIPPGVALLNIIASNPLKDRLQQLIESGLWKEPTRVIGDAEEDDYRKQMSSEIKDRTSGKWVDKSKANHYWDASYMNVAAAVMAGII